jgi:hypothetical protein
MTDTTFVIREFKISDLPQCLSLIRTNTPPFFDESEVSEFVDDLTSRENLPLEKRWPYFVLETSGVIRACGGYEIDSKGSAILIWGMVNREEHKKGLGTLLSRYRFQHMSGKAKRIKLDTTPASFGFYRKLGFIQTGYETEGYGPGLDKVLAEKPLPESAL